MKQKTPISGKHCEQQTTVRSAKRLPKKLSLSFVFDIAACAFTGFMALFMSSVLLSAPADAMPQSKAPVPSIDIRVSPPSVTLLVSTQPLRETQAKLPSKERKFAREIQPLLEAKNYTAVLEKFKQRDLHSDSTALQLLRGQVLLSVQRFDEAKAALNAALKTMPSLALAHSSISVVYLHQQDYSNAQKHLQRSIQLGNQSAETYAQLAFVNLQLNQPASAIAGYRNALLLESEQTAWQEGLLFALIQSSAWSQAQALLDELIAKNPNAQRLWLQRTQLALQAKRYSKAISSLEMAVSLGETQMENIHNLAFLHLEYGSPQRAVQLLSTQPKAWFSTSPSQQQVTALLKMANWLSSKQLWGELATLLKTMQKQGKSLSKTHQSELAVYAARMALAKGQTQQARKNIKRAIAKNPTNGDALLLMAQLMKQQNLVEQATLYYLRAEALTTHTERARLGHAQLAIEQQQFTTALQLLRKVLKENPQRHDLQANIRSLERLTAQ